MAGDKPWPQVTNADYTKAAVVIIGGGVSGICTAIDLIKRNNCRNFIILEKSASFGGTWYDNKYPGCCCDVWSLLYSFSFEQNADWSREYSGQEEILEYLRGVAQKYDLYRHVRFNSEVKACRWDEGSKKWEVHVQVNGGKDAEFSPGYTIESDFLVSAVGQLNYPRYPEIAGLDNFKGKMMHSARWDWSYDLKGKRIGIIGNGATAAQIIPEVVKVASHVTVFQRTPNWVVTRGDAPVSAFWRAAYRYLPPLRWRRRAGMMDFREAWWDIVGRPDSEYSAMAKQMTEAQLLAAFPDDPAMREKLMPNYDPGCKRIILSDDYIPALARSNCSLETRKIERITEKGIKVEGGDEEEFDLIVLATGFRTVEFMHPIVVTGAGGRSLKDIWQGGARALYGTVVEDMPNFGMLYGPNTNLGHNSIILMIEAQSRYINAMIGAVLAARRRGGSLAVSPRRERVEVFNAELQKDLANSAFADPRCNSWYKTREGRITNNWSSTVVEYQKVLDRVRWVEDYEIGGDAEEVVRALKRKKESRLGRVVEESRIPSAGLVTAVGVLGTVAAVGGFVANRHEVLFGLRVH
ncbi:FAD/NAD(P)-binding domain-containing protein [Trichodelitschia bisporula]|uniref:FAD/NAD(P)-binding domain-containing protein n=1 Tax=Trichodelitschia bisporula TaxID=703511 RepID=A0A6G1HXG8_9PEZI|nr:FAD/NAD(P)-binding domain-containing protein [Trichodelitschia bisporula]